MRVLRAGTVFYGARLLQAWVQALRPDILFYTVRLLQVEVQLLPDTVAVCRMQVPGTLGFRATTVVCALQLAGALLSCTGAGLSHCSGNRFRVLSPASACVAWVMTKHQRNWR